MVIGCLRVEVAFGQTSWRNLEIVSGVVVLGAGCGWIGVVAHAETSFVFFCFGNASLA